LDISKAIYPHNTGFYHGCSVGAGSPKAPRWDRQPYADSRFGEVRSQFTLQADDMIQMGSKERETVTLGPGNSIGPN